MKSILNRLRNLIIQIKSKIFEIEVDYINGPETLPPPLSKEKELLQKQALKELVQDKVTIKTGADEMALALLSASISDFYEEKTPINPTYFNENSKNIISRYEDLSIEKSVIRSEN